MRHSDRYAETQLEQAIVNADLVITGEGKLDAQSIMGKAPIGVAALAKQYQKPVLAFCGCTEHAATICNVHGIDAFFPILREITTLENALYRETARQNLTDTAEQVFRLIRAMR
ncbi:MAG: glycerate kinase [Ruminococcus callidus]